MTKRDYELIANVLRYNLPEDTRAAIVWAFIFNLERENPRFNAARFMDACGLDSDTVERPSWR